MLKEKETTKGKGSNPKSPIKKASSGRLKLLSLRSKISQLTKEQKEIANKFYPNKEKI